MSEFFLEVQDDNLELDLLTGDEVLVSTVEVPAANGKDLAVFEVEGQYFLSRFTRYGSQLLLLGESIKVVSANKVKIVGKVIAATNGKELLLQQ